MFKLKENGTNIRTEIIAGITTFFTMAYIIFVNPAILSSVPGFDKGGIFVATIVATVIGTLIMGLVANVPYALAPGMGLNAFFTYTVCFGLGFSWQQALAMVFICGVINIIITVTNVRKAIIKSIPRTLQLAIGAGIGLFIAYIGLKDANILKFTVDPWNIVNDPALAGGTIVSNGGAIPALVNFSNPTALMAIIGLAITAILMVLRVKGAILIGIVATTLVGIPLKVTTYDPSMAMQVTDISKTAFQLDFGGLLADPAKIIIVIVTVFAFSLTDTFDTIGTFIGTGRKAGIFDEKDENALFSGKGFKSKMDKALFADSIATSIGALVGTSNTTTYVESASGISVGGKTGLTSVITAVMFALCLFLAPVAGIVTTAATAPALIIVGVLMAESLKDIEWTEFEEALPAFMTVIIMPFSYSISNGIAAGFIFYVLAKICRGKAKEVHPLLYLFAVLFIVYFVAVAILKL
ncbi:MAG TPA: NCS2 family permease [Clostridia bacterium]|jgi:AGZA family xanthine/uracil permease-like MFS transporter|nr:NCS2 family permease [Clostridia bacterium]